MQPQLTQTTWLEQPALSFETGALKLITVPGMGAKIVSLFDKQAGREWLLPPVGRAFEPVSYAARFVDQNMSGWDEMFPTIDACAYPGDSAYGGAALPDHGDVWSVPWQVGESGCDAITLTVFGRTLPYRFTRTVKLLDDRTLRLDYEVVNTGGEPFHALWAAHPQFSVDADTRIVLPPSVDHLINVYASNEFNTIGQAYAWSRAETSTGDLLALDRIGGSELSRCRKFYVPPDMPASWAALQQGTNGNWVRVSWDTHDVPYLGLWVDEGLYNVQSTVALEPSTGYYDSLAAAHANKRIPCFLPGSSRRWYLDIEIGTGLLT